MEKLELSIFDLSPIPMWIQDYSSIQKVFEEWTKLGITDLKEYLTENPSRLLPYLNTIKTTRINQSTLRLYEANNLDEILQNFAKFHFEEITPEQINFFAGLWEQKIGCTFSAINYTCTGRQIDIQLRANILEDKAIKWDQILLTTEDISASQNARRFAESIFLNSPTALCVLDYSEIKLAFDQLKQQEISSLENYIVHNPNFVKMCFENIKNIGVNQALLDLFQATDEDNFVHNLWQIIRESSQQNFYKQLLALWNGEHQHNRECEYQTIHGEILNIREQLVIFPNSHNNWDTVQIAFTDFTERKKLENHLLFISKHDHLTQLYNRTFFNEEIIRIQANSYDSVSCIFFDINGLKEINDIYGHDQGDKILRRFGKILKASITQTSFSASRLGGDEFVILMPTAKQTHIHNLLKKIINHLEIDQIKHPDFPIRVAIGYATSQSNETIEALLKRADEIMYENKQAFYNSSLKG